MSGTDRPFEAAQDPSEAEESEGAASPAMPAGQPPAGARQRKPTVGDYLGLVNPRNLVELASELLDQAANPYGTKRRRRKKKTD
jgi:hypothetical protein